MKKLLLSIFLIPLLFGFGSTRKNQINRDFAMEKPQISRVLRSAQSDDFISYWTNEFRVEWPAVCDITKDAYQEMYSRYEPLSKEDKVTVNAAPDIEEGVTIGQVIKTLTQKYYPNNNKTKNEKKKLDQSAIIIIAVVVALVGATSISILFILKNQKVIK